MIGPCIDDGSESVGRGGSGNSCRNGSNEGRRHAGRELSIGGKVDGNGECSGGEGKCEMVGSMFV